MITKEKLLKEKERILKNIENKNKRLEVIEQELKELENKKWKPKDGERYYVIDITGVVSDRFNNFITVTDSAFAIGNCFKTEEEAEFEVERLKVLEELKEFSYEFSDEEWKNANIDKYYIYYNYYDSFIEIEVDYCWKHDVIYFKTQEDVQKAIDKIGEERLKKYYFKVGNNG